MADAGEESIKLVLVGDGACGKTCSLFVYARNEFPAEYIPTVFENYQIDLQVGPKSLQLQLFDTAGQDDYERLRPLSYPGANVILMLHDISNPLTFENVISKWLKEVRHYLPDVPIVLCGNKMDLRDDPVMKTKLQQLGMAMKTNKEIEETVKEVQEFSHFCEFSAMNNEGVQQAFMKAAEIGYRYKKSQEKDIIGVEQEAPPCACSLL